MRPVLPGVLTSGGRRCAHCPASTDNSLPGRQTKDSPAPYHLWSGSHQRNARLAQLTEWPGILIQSSQPESG